MPHALLPGNPAGLRDPQILRITQVAGGMGFALLERSSVLGLGLGRLGRMQRNNANKPQVGKTDVAVTVLDRLLSYLRPVVLIGTVLIVILAVYAMAWILTRR
jgi:hypothetical protein